MLTAFDTANDVTGHAHELLAAGIAAIGVYARTDRCPPSMVQGLSSVGIRLWTVFERGNPTQASYFTEEQAELDAAAFLQWASLVGMPKGAPVFWVADYDSAPEDVMAYATAIRKIVNAAGYLASVYANGDTCRALKEAGLVHYTWLSQSTGFAGYQMWVGQADILQEASTTVLGFDVDGDTVRSSDVTWALAEAS